MIPGIQHQSPEQQIETLTGEALFFGLLGKLIYTYPVQSWIEPLLQENVFSEAPFAENQPEVIEGLEEMNAWNQAALQRPPAEVARELEEDYQHLFVGMGETVAPPWESVYLTRERLVFQEPTFQVRAWYRRFGLEIENLGTEPDDHAGLELIFFGHLASLALEAQGRGDQPRYLEVLSSQSEFLRLHLLKWVFLWCRDARDHARTGFYRGAARCIAGAVKEAASLLEVDLQRKAK